MQDFYQFGIVMQGATRKGILSHDVIATGVTQLVSLIQ